MPESVLRCRPLLFDTAPAANRSGFYRTIRHKVGEGEEWLKWDCAPGYSGWNNASTHLGGSRELGYRLMMQHALRGLFVYLFAAVLVFNGGAFRALGGTSPAHAHGVAVATLDSADHEQHQGHSHAEHNGTHTAFDQVPGNGHSHIGAKCCTMCIAFGNLMPAVTATATQLQYRLIVFSLSRGNLTGHQVALDPDIPKTIV